MIEVDSGRPPLFIEDATIVVKQRLKLRVSCERIHMSSQCKPSTAMRFMIVAVVEETTSWTSRCRCGVLHR